jgi:malonyl-CoA decarboxylase
MNNRFLKNLFRSFSESVGGLLDRLGPAKTEKKDILQLAETLISGRGEASDVAVAREFLTAYDGLTEDAVLSFLALLDRQFGPDQARLRGTDLRRRGFQTPLLVVVQPGVSGFTAA